MRYDNPELIQRLAGEYVLGTLRGAARRRFDRLRKQRPLADDMVRDWESKLTPLALALPPETPPPEVWNRVARRLDIHERERVSRPLFWQALAAGFATLTLALLLTMLTRPGPSPAEPARVAILADAQGAPLWLVQVQRETSRLVVEPVGQIPALDGQVYELWMLPDDGPPVSLGLLPDTGLLATNLPPDAMQRIARSAAVAVSLEPPGGSPTGQPTGPVVFSAPLLGG